MELPVANPDEVIRYPQRAGPGFSSVPAKLLYDEYTDIYIPLASFLISLNLPVTNIPLLHAEHLKKASLNNPRNRLALKSTPRALSAVRGSLSFHTVPR
jgi:hypothetical protein